MPLCTEPAAARRNRRRVREIYRASFPREERMPFFLMCLLAKMPQTQFLAFREGEQVCGFAYLAVLDGMAFLLFLAVDPALRSRGYGSAILREIAALYPDCKRLVSIERCDAPADNAAQRLRRAKKETRTACLFFVCSYSVTKGSRAI